MARRPSFQAIPVEGEHLLYGFLTTGANGEVAPIPRNNALELQTAEKIEARQIAPPPTTMRGV